MRLLVLALALCAVVGLAKSEKKIVCYFGSWAIYRHGIGKFEIPSFDSNMCTHLIYTFAVLRGGVIVSHDPNADIVHDGFGQVNRLKEKNPNLKIMIALGGWEDGSAMYSNAALTPEGRTKLANSIVDFVKKYRFDGFDLDWEYPADRAGSRPEDKRNFILFLQELHQKLSKDGKELSVAVSANINKAPQMYDIPELAKTVDFINLMTYDYHGSWDNALGHNSPLYPSPLESGASVVLNIDSTIKYWLQQGAPAEKLILGLPFYGKSFIMANPSQPTLGSPSSSGGEKGPYSQNGMFFYLELCEMFRQGGWTHVNDEIQRVPHAYKGNLWISYDDQGSLAEKTRYAQKMNLGGVMIWSIESDDITGVCGTGTFPLLKTVNSVLRGGQKPSVPNYPQTTPKSNKTPYITTEHPNNPDQSHTVPTHPSDVACTHQGYVRVKDDCSAYHYCEARPDGSYYAHSIMHCPPGLMYNTANGQCDWPANVKC